VKPLGPDRRGRGAARRFAALQSRKGGFRRRRSDWTAKRPCCRSPSGGPMRYCSTGCCRWSPASRCARQIRRAPATRSMPVIMLTARGEEGDRGARPQQAAPTIMSSNVQPQRARRPAARRDPAGPAECRRADPALCRCDDGSGGAPRLPRRQAGPSRPDPNSACCATSCSTRAASSRASSCSTRCGARMPRSSCAPLMSISGGCARRSTKPVREICCAPCGRSATPLDRVR